MQRASFSSRGIAIVAGMLFATVLPVCAQSANSGQVNGLVSDPSGTAIPNAKITVKNLGTDSAREGVTQNNGSFSIQSILPARYSLTVTATGFRRWQGWCWSQSRSRGSSALRQQI